MSRCAISDSLLPNAYSSRQNPSSTCETLPTVFHDNAKPRHHRLVRWPDSPSSADVLQGRHAAVCGHVRPVRRSGAGGALWRLQRHTDRALHAAGRRGGAGCCCCCCCCCLVHIGSSMSKRVVTPMTCTLKAWHQHLLTLAGFAPTAVQPDGAAIQPPPDQRPPRPRPVGPGRCCLLPNNLDHILHGNIVRQIGST